jgi:hypothetical protein
MDGMIARRSGFDTWPFSLVKDPSRIEFVVKHNGYTMTFDWVVASGFWLRPTRRWQLPSTLPEKSATTMHRTRKGDGLQTNIASLQEPREPYYFFFFLLLVLPLSSYPYTDLPLVLPFLQLPFNLHILLSLIPHPQYGAQENATQAVSRRGAPTDARTSGR